jgi:hypothetical protein
MGSIQEAKTVLLSLQISGGVEAMRRALKSRLRETRQFFDGYDSRSRVGCKRSGNDPRSYVGANRMRALG